MGCRARPWREHLTIRPLVVLPQAARRIALSRREDLLLFVGDDWAEDHHDVELQDDLDPPILRRRVRQVTRHEAGLCLRLVGDGVDGAKELLPSRSVLQLEDRQFENPLRLLGWHRHHPSG